MTSALSRSKCCKRHSLFLFKTGTCPSADICWASSMIHTNGVQERSHILECHFDMFRPDFSSLNPRLRDWDTQKLLEGIEASLTVQSGEENI